MKKNGLTTAANQREEEPVLITSTGAIFEEFLPKESESGMSQMSTKEVCNALPTKPTKDLIVNLQTKSQFSARFLTSSFRV